MLALTNAGDLVIDPYLGVGSTACAAVMHERRAAGADLVPEYIDIARRRVGLALCGMLRRRPLGQPIYQPGESDRIAKRPDYWDTGKTPQTALFG